MIRDILVIVGTVLTLAFAAEIMRSEARIIIEPGEHRNADH